MVVKGKDVVSTEAEPDAAMENAMSAMVFWSLHAPHCPGVVTDEGAVSRREHNVLGGDYGDGVGEIGSLTGHAISLLDLV